MEGEYLDKKVKTRPFKMAHSHTKNKGIHYTTANIPAVKYNEEQMLSNGRTVRLNVTGGNKRRGYASTKGFSNLT